MPVYDGWELKSRVALTTIERPQCTAARSNHMSVRIEATNEINRRSGTIVVNLYLAQEDPGYIRMSLLTLFCFSPSSISSVFHYT